MQKRMTQKRKQAFRIRDACIAATIIHGCKKENIRGMPVLSLEMNGFTIWISSFTPKIRVLDIWYDGVDGTKVTSLRWTGADDLTVVSFRRGAWEQELLNLADAGLPA